MMLMMMMSSLHWRLEPGRLCIRKGQADDDDDDDGVDGDDTNDDDDDDVWFTWRLQPGRLLVRTGQAYDDDYDDDNYDDDDDDNASLLGGCSFAGCESGQARQISSPTSAPAHTTVSPTRQPGQTYLVCNVSCVMC